MIIEIADFPIEGGGSGGGSFQFASVRHNQRISLRVFFSMQKSLSFQVTWQKARVPQLFIFGFNVDIPTQDVTSWAVEDLNPLVNCYITVGNDHFI